MGMCGVCDSFAFKVENKSKSSKSGTQFGVEKSLKTIGNSMSLFFGAHFWA